MKNSTQKPPKAPNHLSRPQKRLWGKILGDFEIQDAAALRLLQAAMEALDRCEACRVEIEKDGQTIKDRFGQTKPHPLLAVERDSRASFVVCLKNLQLDIEPPSSKPGRRY